MISSKHKAVSNITHPHQDKEKIPNKRVIQGCTSNNQFLRIFNCAQDVQIPYLGSD